MCVCVCICVCIPSTVDQLPPQCQTNRAVDPRHSGRSQQLSLSRSLDWPSNTHTHTHISVSFTSCCFCMLTYRLLLCCNRGHKGQKVIQDQEVVLYCSSCKTYYYGASYIASNVKYRKYSKVYIIVIVISHQEILHDSWIIPSSAIP